MSGINYNLKKIKGIAFDIDGVLSPSTIPMSVDGIPMRMVNIKDGYALQLAVKCGLKIAIITGGDTKAVQVRYSALGITDIFQKSANKLPVLKEWMESHGLSPEEVAYMGDDIPDLQCMRYVGLPCCPYDAAWEVKESSLYISPFGGGYGCGRDLLEHVMRAQALWMSDAKAFGW